MPDFSGARVPARHLQISLLLLLCLSHIQCDGLSCSGSEDTTSDSNEELHWIRRAPAASVAPTSARVMVVSSSLQSLLAHSRAAWRATPRPTDDELGTLWQSKLGWQPWEAAGWSRVGVDQNAPASMFYDRGWWVVVATLDDAEAYAAYRTEQPSSVGTAETGDFKGMNFTLTGQRLHLAADREVLIAALKFEKSPSDAASGDGLPSAWLPDERSFVDRLRYRDLLVRGLESRDPAGVVRPAPWLSNIETSGQSTVLLQRIISQLGPVAFSTELGDEGRTLEMEVLTPGEPGAPRVVEDLGEAGGQLPPVGGLIEPGILGVARVSVDPASLYQLVVSGLPAERRTELDGFWERLNEELQIDARANVLENVQGHAVVAVYGIKTETLEQAGEHWFNSIIQLAATREAVLLPIKDREKMGRVLDALTTVTKGRLQRQAVGDTIQYAFFEDGELKWAFILGDNHVLYVDSAVAFDQAMQYERSAHPLGDSMAETGVSALLGPEQISGVYLDTASLANLLKEAGAQEGAQLLAPLRRGASDDSDRRRRRRHAN